MNQEENGKYAEEKISNTQESVLVDVAEIQRRYLPMSKRRIRKIILQYTRTVRIGNKIFADRKQVEQLLTDPDREHIL